MSNALNENIDLRELFPFYFVVSIEEMMVEEVGPGMVKLLGDIQQQSFEDHFKLVKPYYEGVFSPESFEKFQKKNHIIEAPGANMTFRGTLHLSKDKTQVIYTGSPYFYDLDGFSASGLQFNDFPVTDQTPDMVQMMQMVKINRTELVEQNQRIDYLFSHVDVLIASYSKSGRRDYFNMHFRSFNKSLTINQQDDLQQFVQGCVKSHNTESVTRFEVASETFEIVVRKMEDKLLLMGTNITKQLALDKAKKEKEMIESQSRFISNFLSNMSHEIRTPLNGILGMLDVLSDTELSKKQKTHLNFIKVSGASLLNIINDVLDLSKIQSGNFELKPARSNILDTLKESKRLFVSIGKQFGNRIKIDLQSHVPMFMEFDKLRYQQILNNLISNANKFTTDGVINIEVSVEDGLLKTAVSDTGVGIKESDFNKLFKEFSQIDSSYTKKNDGTGLGLALCKKLCHLFGGTISCRSVYGEGSVFTFTVGFKKCEDQQVNKNKRLVCDIEALSEKKVLLVEDKDLNQKVAILMLEKFGCEVEVADNGLIALNKYEDGKYDFILMDIQMPIMDGVTATRMIKESSLNTPPIIALSANAMEGDEQTYMDNGMDGYIAKPITRDKLFDSLIRFLNL